MPVEIFQDVKRVAIRAVAVVLLLLVVATAALTWLWNTRADLAESGLHAPISDDVQEGRVTFTWFGVTTLLFDDGETQILIDGFFSRPSFIDTVLNRNVTNDIPMINYVLNEYGMARLAAIIPVHSHFDHAMDIGAIANRSSASIIGSPSTANIARGVGVPEDQIIVAGPGGEFSFGEFTVSLVRSTHAPVGLRGAVPLPGVVDQPLQLPAPITAWREGGSYSIVIAHPEGTTIVQGSAGYVEGALDEVQADVVMLGVGLLEGLGRDYAERYWQSVVTSTGAKRVFPVHFDDYTQPLGEVRLPPRLLDNFVHTSRWLQEFRDTWDRDTLIFLPQSEKRFRFIPRRRPTPERAVARLKRRHQGLFVLPAQAFDPVFETLCLAAITGATFVYELDRQTAPKVLRTTCSTAMFLEPTDHVCCYTRVQCAVVAAKNVETKRHRRYELAGGHPFGGSRVFFEQDGRSNRPRDDIAAAVRADAIKTITHAINAERTFERADHCKLGVRWQVDVTGLTVGVQLEHRSGIATFQSVAQNTKCPDLDALEVFRCLGKRQRQVSGAVERVHRSGEAEFE